MDDVKRGDMKKARTIQFAHLPLLKDFPVLEKNAAPDGSPAPARKSSTTSHPSQTFRKA